MKRPSKDLSPKKAIMKVEHLIKETEDILGGKLD